MNVQIKRVAAFAMVLALQAASGYAWAREFGFQFQLPQVRPAHRTTQMPHLQLDGRAVEGVYELNLPQGIQSFAFDDVRNETYVVSVKKTDGHEQSSIYRFQTVTGAIESPIDGAEEVPFLGHQGLGLESRKGNTPRLWASVRDDGYRAVRFRYDRGQLIDVQFYKLFPDSFFAKNEALPTVCDGQRYLAVRGRHSGSRMVIRLFDLQKIISRGPGDYSDAFSYEWEVNPSITQKIDGAYQGVQSLACDEEHVYILAGNANSKTAKRIHVYTLDGRMVRKNDDVTVGLDSAQSDPGGYFYEPEGLAFRHHGDTVKLFMGVVSGPGRKHVNRLWPIDLQ